MVLLVYDSAMTKEIAELLEGQTGTRLYEGYHLSGSWASDFAIVTETEEDFRYALAGVIKAVAGEESLLDDALDLLRHYRKEPFGKWFIFY